MFKMVCKNLVGQLRNQRMLFLLLVLNIVISCLVICFSYGLYQNYNMVLKEGENEEINSLAVYIDCENLVSPGSYTDIRCAADISPSMITDMLTSLSDSTKSNIDIIVTEFMLETSLSTGSTDFTDEPCPSYSDDQEPFYMTVKTLVGVEGDKFIDMDKTKDYFTEEQYNSGEKILLVADDLYDDETHYAYFAGGYSGKHQVDIGWTIKPLPQGTDHLLMNGESYKIIGTVPHALLTKNVVIIPMPSVPASAKIYCSSGGKHSQQTVMDLSFKEPVTKDQYADIKDALSYLGGNVYLQEIKFTEATEIYYYKTIMLISVVIALLAAVNMAILYRYILEKRSSQLAIFRICGCSKGRAVMSYLLECLVINAPLFALMQLVYHKLIMPRLTRLFPHMAGAYSFKLYAAIFGIYIAMSTLVMLVMIIHTIRKHSLVMLKGAGKAKSRFGIMKVFEVIQLAAVLSMLVLIVSVIISRYSLYTPFEKYFERKGYLAEPENTLSYSDAFNSFNVQSMMCYESGFTTDGKNFGGISYCDEMIDAYKPPMVKGKWLDETDETFENAGYIPAVITSCGGRYDIGDVITFDFIENGEDGEEIFKSHIQYKIVGILKDKVSIVGYKLFNIETKNVPLLNKDYRDIYGVFSDSFEDNDILLTRTSDFLAAYDSDSGLLKGPQIFICDNMTDEEFKSFEKELQKGFAHMQLSQVKENSLSYIYQQMYTLFPIAVCIFILTVISTVSISAIYTKRQLRNYAIFYICGARWRTCALRSLKNSAITCGIAAAISALVLIVGKLTLLKETVISFGVWHLAVCALVIVLYLALSMIMPLAIIGSNEPKEVLKEE